MRVTRISLFLMRSSSSADRAKSQAGVFASEVVLDCREKDMPMMLVFLEYRRALNDNLLGDTGTGSA